MITYKGFTRDELITRFIYNPVSGEFFSGKRKTLITAMNKGRLVLSVRRGSMVFNLSRAKVALMIMGGRLPEKDEMIKFIDGDCNNTAYSNISIIKSKDNVVHRPSVVYSTVETSCDGVHQLLPKGYYVVRRGNTQAIYRTYDFDEAVAVRKEWEKDKTIHRWDKTMPSYYMPDMVS